MCRSIVQLRREGEPASREELEAAALQFVRKISGFREPSRANAAGFARAVSEIADASERLLDGLVVRRRSPEASPPALHTSQPGS